MPRTKLFNFIKKFGTGHGSVWLEHPPKAEGLRLMYYVYVLRSDRNGKHYIGYTNDLHRRILEHNRNKTKQQFTRFNGPWKILFFEEFDLKSDAIKREKFLKSGKGRDYIKKNFLEM